MKKKGDKNLTYTQRLQLEACLSAKLHKKVIANKLGVCLATVYNEIKRGEYYATKSVYDVFGDKTYKQVKKYSPNKAEERYRFGLTSHGPEIKLGNDYEFVNYIEKRVLIDKLSPCAVLGEINRNNLFKTKITKPTLYRYIDQGIFPNMRKQDLPFKKRVKRYRKTVIKKAPKGVSIEKRPLEVAKRNSFGHWEMDLVIGKKNCRSALLVLSERLSRYEIIMRVDNRKPQTIVKSLNKLEYRFGKKFRNVFKTITVDNGVEFSDFVGLERSIYRGRRTSIFYCHPYNSCERGTNERLNREIRRLIPKGVDLSHYTNMQIQFVEDWLNNYPREVLGFATSSEMFDTYVTRI